MTAPTRRCLRRLNAAVRTPLRQLRARVDGSDRGAVLPILALFITVLVLATSLAVDVGRVAARNRDLQKVADLVAMDAVRSIGGGKTAQLVTPGSTFLTAVEASAANNDFPVTCQTASNPTAAPYEATCTHDGSDDTLTVDLGFWCTTADTAIAASPCVGAAIPSDKPGVFFDDTAGDQVPTAVHVTAGDHVKYYFGLGLVKGQTTSRAGTSNLAATADFGLGTSLANLDTNQSALLGPLLNGLLGFNLTTQVVGWNGLANADVTIGDLASNLGLGLGTGSSFLNTNVTLVQFVNASAAALTQEGDLADAALLNSISANLPSPLRNATLTLGDLFDISASDAGAALASSVNVLQLLSAAAQVANGSNSITLASGGLTIPGVATVSDVHLTVTEPVKFAYRAHVGDTLEAGQVRLSIALANINPSLLTNVVNSLLPGLLGLTVSIQPADTTVGIADGRATLEGVTCAPTPGFTLGVSSGAASLTTTLSLNVSANLLLFPNALAITGSITATQAQSDDSHAVGFAFPPDAPGAAKDAGGGSLFWGAPQITSNSLKLTLLGGLSLPIGTLLQGLTAGLVDPLVSGIDTSIIQPLQSLLGLTIGDATVFAGPDGNPSEPGAQPPVHCTTPQLVQ